HQFRSLWTKKCALPPLGGKGTYHKECSRYYKIFRRYGTEGLGLLTCPPGGLSFWTNGVKATMVPAVTIAITGAVILVVATPVAPPAMAPWAPAPAAAAAP